MIFSTTINFTIKKLHYTNKNILFKKNCNKLNLNVLSLQVPIGNIINLGLPLYKQIYIILIKISKILILNSNKFKPFS